MGWTFEGIREGLWRFTPILVVRPPERPRCGVPTVEVELPDQTDTTRWRALAQLDVLLDQLERATLHDMDPPKLAIDGLRALGLDDPDRYCAVELIDIVLHAQWSLLRAGPAPSIAERQAVVREARCLWERGLVWSPVRDADTPRQPAPPPLQLAADGQL